MGNQAILSLETLHFSKAFFGTNGVSLKAGFSTPDYEEAMVKKTAIGQAKKGLHTGRLFEVWKYQFSYIRGICKGTGDHRPQTARGIFKK